MARLVNWKSLPLITIAAANTPQKLTATSILTSDFQIQPSATNGGASICIGDSTISATNGILLLKGSISSFTVGSGSPTLDHAVDLSTWYVVSDTQNDTIRVQYRDLV